MECLTLIQLMIIFSHWDNMLVVTTGILSRSGGINPTAAVLPLVDEFVNTHLNKIK